MAGPLNFLAASFIVEDPEEFRGHLSSTYVEGSGTAPTTVEVVGAVYVSVYGGVPPYSVSVTAVGSADNVNAYAIKVNDNLWSLTFNRFFSTPSISLTSWNVKIEDDDSGEITLGPIDLRLSGFTPGGGGVEA